MGRDSNDIDIVVSGVTSEEMLNRKFTHIMSSDDNANVPVFVDNMGREVAIARSEISTGDGYDEFEMDIVDPSLSHKEALKLDLERRDLTINAISVNIRTGEVYDPFNGLDDIDRGIIRHVSPAFAEDPLRVLRAARYAIRFGFDIHSDTMNMMRSLSDKISSLPDDRFGLELMKALSQGQNPRRYFDILSDVNALDKAYPNIANLKSIPAGPQEYHQEGSSYEHTMRVLNEMYKIRGNDTEALLSALFHDIGKVQTNEDILPHHYNHEKDGKALAEEIRKNLQINREYKGVMSLSARVHGNIRDIGELNTSTIIDIADMIRDNPLSIEQLADLVVSDEMGRVPKGSADKENIVSTLKTAIDVLNNVKAKQALESRDYEHSDIGSEITGEQFGNMIRQDRVEELRQRLS
jgi:tRNA nucleotidyltransferase (CCA-adding enzyme)